VSSALKITVDSKELRKTLERLPANLNERVRKKGARKALAPLTKEMAALWRSASYRGKGTHRRAIAAATQLDIRRLGGTATAPLRSRIGVRYGRKGGARAKGRQRVYHLLELGFRHKAAGKRIQGAYRSFTWAMRTVTKASNAVANETLAEAKRLLGGRP
jgi:hypothetical protein